MSFSSNTTFGTSVKLLVFIATVDVPKMVDTSKAVSHNREGGRRLHQLTPYIYICAYNREITCQTVRNTCLYELIIVKFSPYFPC